MHTELEMVLAESERDETKSSLREAQLVDQQHQQHLGDTQNPNTPATESSLPVKDTP